jgi:tetratricopeptide (TPR) repeat protein
MSVITLPALRAAAELRRDQPARAIELLQPLASHELHSPGITYLRGLAYLDLGKGTEAAAEFRKIIDHKGIHWRFHTVFPDDTGALRPLSYLGLARAETLAANTAGARTAYQDFLALWRDADEDLPTLLEARKEYAALK